MKRVLLAALIIALLVPSPGFARGWRGYRGGGHRGGGYWGGAVAAGIFGGFATGILLDRALAPWPAYYPEPYYPAPYYPGGYPYYSYPAPYYQPAPMIAAQPAPQAYQPPQQQYWYWCDNPQGYYPYVQQCPSNWRQVLPQPPPPTR